MDQAGERRICPTCRRGEPDVRFYVSRERECRSCKAARSRRNRREQARQMAAVERLIGLLAVIANQASGRAESNSLEEAS